LALIFASLLASCAGGTIDRGSKYGVRVGMTLEEANTILERRGMRRLPTQTVGCAARYTQLSEIVVPYSRRGDGQPPVSCLFVRDGRVTVIAWEAF
jgi:hypothetical protein